MKAILSNPHIVFGVVNKLVKPVGLPINRLLSTVNRLHIHRNVSLRD